MRHPPALPSGLLLALLLSGAAMSGARAQDRPIPNCAGLVPMLVKDSSSQRNGAAPLSVDGIVEDLQSKFTSRLCSAVAHYKDSVANLVYTGKYTDDKHQDFGVDAHDATEDEAARRASTLRIKFHPQGQDGTFSFTTYVPYCTDAEFIKLATTELHYGISFRDAFYREPDFRVIDIATNGYGSGILSNCIATVGNDTDKGEIFLGTNWVITQEGRRYEFYILSVGPEGYKLKNRLWEMNTE